MAITCLGLLLTQTDKILLSRLLPLKAYGYYVLASAAANGLVTLSGPITAAFYPRFTALATLGHEAAARAVYHQGAQLVTVLVGVAGVVLILFHDDVILLWTGDPMLVRQVAPLMARAGPRMPAECARVDPLPDDVGPWVDRAHGQGQHRCRVYPGACHPFGCSALRPHRRCLDMGGV